MANSEKDEDSLLSQKKKKNKKWEAIYSMNCNR